MIIRTEELRSFIEETVISKIKSLQDSIQKQDRNLVTVNYVITGENALMSRATLYTKYKQCLIRKDGRTYVDFVKLENEIRNGK